MPTDDSKQKQTPEDIDNFVILLRRMKPEMVATLMSRHCTINPPLADVMKKAFINLNNIVL